MRYWISLLAPFSVIEILGIKVFGIICVLLFYLHFFTNFSKNITNSKMSLFLLYVVPLIFIVLISIGDFNKIKVILYLLIFSLFIFSSKETINTTALKHAFSIHVFFYVVSVMLLFFTGKNFISDFLYGVDRSGLPGYLSSYVTFRAQGLFLEASTMAANFLCIFIILERVTKDMTLIKLTCLFISLLSFSFASLIATLFLVDFILRKFYEGSVRISYFTIPLLILFSSGFLFNLFNFIFVKTEAFISFGLENLLRFQLLYETIENPLNLIYGVDGETIDRLVLFDLGFFLSLISVAGMYSFPFMVLLFFSLLSNPIILILFLTKLSGTNPLLWMVITLNLNENKKSSGSIR